MPSPAIDTGLPSTHVSDEVPDREVRVEARDQGRKTRKQRAILKSIELEAASRAHISSDARFPSP